jgi:hypothetical protein
VKKRSGAVCSTTSLYCVATAMLDEGRGEEGCAAAKHDCPHGTVGVTTEEDRIALKRARLEEAHSPRAAAAEALAAVLDVKGLGGRDVAVACDHRELLGLVTQRAIVIAASARKAWCALNVSLQTRSTPHHHPWHAPEQRCGLAAAHPHFLLSSVRCDVCCHFSA